MVPSLENRVMGPRVVSVAGQSQQSLFQSLVDESMRVRCHTGGCGRVGGVVSIWWVMDLNRKHQKLSKHTTHVYELAIALLMTTFVS